MFYPMDNGHAKLTRKIISQFRENFLDDFSRRIFFSFYRNDFLHLAMIGLVRKPSIIIALKSLSLPYRQYISSSTSSISLF